MSLNTNMFLESICKKLEYYYIEGKQNRRVDKCISSFIRFARDMIFERTIQMMKNKPTFLMEQIAHKHCQSKDIDACKIK